MGRAEASADAEWLADHVVKCQFEAAILDREMDGKGEVEKIVCCPVLSGLSSPVLYVGGGSCQDPSLSLC